jgi:hypothetical protein
MRFTEHSWNERMTTAERISAIEKFEVPPVIVNARDVSRSMANMDIAQWPDSAPSRPERAFPCPWHYRSLAEVVHRVFLLLP